MKLAQFKTRTLDGVRIGLLHDDAVADLATLAAAVKSAGGQTAEWMFTVSGVLDIIRRGEAALAEMRALLSRRPWEGLERAGNLALPLDALEFLPAVYPGKILAIGRNYVDHAIEGGAPPPAAPIMFTKLPNSLNAHNAPVALHAISSQIDFEAELAVVIGRRATRVSEAEALDHVCGYTLINDVSARDLQFGDGQWVRGKSLDGFAPLGPFITTRDEVRDVHALQIEGRLNGEVMQRSNTGKMIFKTAYLISYLSQGITLEPGDVIATGTPDGVGIFRNPPVLLKPGDVYEVVIEQLGTLRNEFVSPT